jgi:uncharacterized membrane protein (DUF485 family)
MINTKHLLKVSAVWMSITYIICYAGVALFPSLRPDFMKYALHTELSFGESYITLGNFIAGLVIWDILALFGVWFFAALFNKIKK